MKIRQATIKDLNGVRKLLNSNSFLLGDYAKKDVELFLKSKLIKVFICEIEGELVGILKADVYWSYLDISLIIVDPTFRGKGVGTALMQYIEAFAKKKKISRLGGFTVLSNDKMKGLFEKLHYKKGHKYYFYYKDLK